MWDRQRFEAEEFIAAEQGRDGTETIAHNARVFTVREGRIVHMKAFQTKVEALKAAGRPA
jgi:hypothetical protein